MSKPKRPIKRITPDLFDYGLTTPQKVAVAKIIREIFNVKTNDNKK